MLLSRLAWKSLIVVAIQVRQTFDDDKETFIMEPLTTLFQDAAINEIVGELHSHMTTFHNNYEKPYSQPHYDNLCDIKRSQGTSTTW